MYNKCVKIFNFAELFILTSTFVTNRCYPVKSLQSSGILKLTAHRTKNCAFKYRSVLQKGGKEKTGRVRFLRSFLIISSVFLLRISWKFLCYFCLQVPLISCASTWTARETKLRKHETEIIFSLILSIFLKLFYSVRVCGYVLTTYRRFILVS
jgi:hypothetical protein